jgi:hypothetical protein
MHIVVPELTYMPTDFYSHDHSDPTITPSPTQTKWAVPLVRRRPLQRNKISDVYPSTVQNKHQHQRAHVNQYGGYATAGAGSASDPGAAHRQ